MTTSNLANDRVQTLLQNSKRKQSSLRQWISLRSRFLLMKKHRDRLREIQINFVHRFLDSQTRSEHSISIRLKNSSWKKINVSIVTNQIISAEIVQNSKNQESLRWRWRRQKTREKISLRRKRDEDEWVDYIVFSYERWSIWRKFNIDRLFSEKILIDINNKHWCHWIRFRRWIICAENLWRDEHWIYQINEERSDKNIRR